MHAQALPDRFQRIETARSEAFVTALLTQPDHYLCVAEENQAIIGLIEFREVRVDAPPPLVQRRFVAIESVIVAQSHQRRGVGRGLMQHVEEWAATQTIAVIEFSVYAFNQNAIRFYESLGYTVVSQRMAKQA